MLAKKCDVTIYKGMQTKIPKNIYEHEVTILEAIYGEGTVEGYKRREHYFPEGKKYKVEGDVISYEIEEMEYEEEYDRVATQYGMHPEVRMTWAEYVYGPRTEGRMEKTAKEKYTADFGKGVYVSPKKTSKALIEKDDGLQSLTAAEIKVLLQEKSISFSPMDNKVMLLTLARKAGLNVATEQENAG